MRPDLIVVGGIRGGEALDMLTFHDHGVEGQVDASARLRQRG
jgi:Flp pilus assembly CpaF family ATPase